MPINHLKVQYTTFSPTRCHNIAPAWQQLMKLRSNYQTRQCWSNMGHESVTALPISCLKFFQKHILVYYFAVIWETLWPGCHVENGCWQTQTGYQNKEQRGSDYNTHRGSVTSFSAQDTITPLYLYIANSCLLTSSGADWRILHL